MHRHTATIVATGAIAFVAPALAQVTGDEMCNPINVEEDSPVTVNLATMTPSAGAPSAIAGQCGFLGWNASTKDAWFRFSPPSDGRLSVLLCDSNFDTSVVLYQTTACLNPFRIGCNDDGCQPSGPTYQSKLLEQPVLGAASGGPVFIRVGGFNGTTGTATLSVSFTPNRGDARCWGSNSNGQCSVPTNLTGPLAAVDAGLLHTIVLREDGTLRAWGSNTDGESAVPSGTFRRVAAGGSHNLAIRSYDALVTAWGRNAEGQSSVPADLGACLLVAAGDNHSLALKTDGTVRAWGRNTEGQCNVPAALGVVKRIAAGGTHSMAIVGSGLVSAWGSNASGQSSVPGTLGACLAIAGGGRHSVAIRQDRTVAAWGANDFGQSTVPADLGTCSQVDAGASFTVALRDDGSIRAWGQNSAGQTTVPTGLKPGIAIAAGAGHVATVLAADCDGNGVNDYLELADHDCNYNDIHDCVDIAAGLIEDCNDNGICDNQEKMGLVQVNSGNMGPFGYLQNRGWTIPAVSQAASRVWLKIYAVGDLSTYLEYVTVRIGSSSWRVFESGGADCVQVNNLTSTGAPTIVIQPSDFNALIRPDGSLRIDLEPSIAVDPAACGGTSWIRAELSYNNALPPDCNANGLIDSCEIAAGYSPDTNGNGVVDACEAPLNACAPDLNGDGTVNGADLGALLGAWGPASTGAAVDLNADGVVNGADLGALLGAWGPCAD
jgi:alpha-tubulin suppressor-like RCC1 family protein